jgi:hypothetical protein
MMWHPHQPRLLSACEIAALALHITKRPPVGDQSGLWD